MKEGVHMAGMLLNDIVEEIAEKTGHSLSDKSIVRKVNNLLAEIHRKYKRVPTVSKIALVSGLAEYPIPCPLSNIIQVLVDGTEYKLRYFHEEADQFYYYLEGTIGLYPKPEEDVDEGILIFHYKQPDELTIDEMEAEPDIESNFRMLLVWGVSKDATNDRDKIKLFRDEYNSLLADYIAATQLPLPDMTVE
jgi:hypothetical protein